MTDDGSLVALAFKIQMWDGRRHVFARSMGCTEEKQQIRVAGKNKLNGLPVCLTSMQFKRKIAKAHAGQMSTIWIETRHN